MIGFFVNGWQEFRGERSLIFTDRLTGSSFCVSRPEILADWGAIHRRLLEKRNQFKKGKRHADDD
jgi:hypothetical protein